MTSGQQLLLTITMYLNSQKHAYISKASLRSVVLPTARKRAWQPVDALDELAVCFVDFPQLVREPTIGRRLTIASLWQGVLTGIAPARISPLCERALHVTVKKLTILSPNIHFE
jgi:hypothetical protein